MNKLAWAIRRGSLSLGRRLSESLGRGGRWCGMALVLPLLLIGASADAQQGNSGVFWQCAPPSSSNPQGGYCPVNTTYPLPMMTEVNGMQPVAGTQVGLTISSVTGLTIPTGATVAIVQAQGTGATSGGQCLFWRDDGTNPSATAGQVLVPNQSLVIKASAAFKMIAASGSGASCTATVSYYK